MSKIPTCPESSSSCQYMAILHINNENTVPNIPNACSGTKKEGPLSSFPLDMCSIVLSRGFAWHSKTNCTHLSPLLCLLKSPFQGNFSSHTFILKCINFLSMALPVTFLLHDRRGKSGRLVCDISGHIVPMHHIVVFLFNIYINFLRTSGRTSPLNAFTPHGYVGMMGCRHRTWDQSMGTSVQERSTVISRFHVSDLMETFYARVNKR